MEKKAITKNKNLLNITLITSHIITSIKINNNNNNITLITIIFYNINISFMQYYSNYIFQLHFWNSRMKYKLIYEKKVLKDGLDQLAWGHSSQGTYKIK